MITYVRVCTLVLLGLGLIGLPEAAPAAKEGFGRKRKIIKLYRVNPPKVLIRGERVSVEVTAADRNDHEVAQRFRAQLSSELVGGDSRLQLDSDRPETLIKIEVLQDEFRHYRESRQETQRRKVGKDSNGKAVYRDYQVTVTYTHLDHHLRFAYTVTEARSGATLLADSSQADYSAVIREGNSVPTQAAIEGNSLERAVSEIVYQLTPTREEIEVLLPKGTLENQITFAEAGLWNRYSENLETMPPLPGPVADAYRQYGIGLAYEALGYSAESSETTLRYLEKAAEKYNLALNANPGEKYFSQPFKGSFLGGLGRSFKEAWGGTDASGRSSGSREPIPPPIRRVETSLAKYRALLDQSKQLLADAGGFAGGEVGAKGNSLAENETQADALTNQQVIEMVAAELDEEIIMVAIQDAVACAFDRSPAGLIQLQKAGVPKTLISRIQSSECGL